MERKLGTLLSYLLMVFEILSTLLVTPLIISSLGQAEYGVYKLVSSLTVYLLMLDLGLGNSVTRYMAKYHAVNDKESSGRFLGLSIYFYTTVAFIAIIIGIGIIWAFPTVFAKGLMPDQIKLGQKLLFIIILNTAIILGTSNFSNTIIACEKFVFSRSVSILLIIVRMILTYVFLKLGFKSIAIVSIHLFITIISRTIYVLYVFFKLKIFPIFRGYNKEFIKEIIGFSLLILLQTIATQINDSVDTVLIGSLVPASAIIIGIYSVGTQIIQYFKSIGTIFTNITMPGVVRLVERKATPDELCNEMVKISRFTFIILSFMWVCFFWFGRQFISFWAGNENLSAYYVALIIMLIYAFTLSQHIGNQVLYAINEIKAQSIVKFVVVILNIFLTIAFIKIHPMIGAAAGTFLSIFIGDLLLGNIIFKKKINISLKKYYAKFFKGILPALIICFGAGKLISLLHLTGFWGFVINVLMMTLIYAFCMFSFGFSPYEKRLICGILNKIFKRKKNHELI